MNHQDNQQLFDFWEFVTCFKCQQPYLSSEGHPTMPFWLTECGHVMCDHHFSQKLCASCGTKGVQAIPLERELEKPMSDWFCQVPTSLDTLTYAIKFQQETMAASLRHYKSKYLQHKALHLQYKNETEELKRVVAMLKSQLRRGDTGEEGWKSSRSSDLLNSNGKRSIAGPPSSSSSSQSLRVGSSPSLSGPGRIVPPFGKQPRPPLLAKHTPDTSHSMYASSSRDRQPAFMTTRPATGLGMTSHSTQTVSQDLTADSRAQYSGSFRDIPSQESTAAEHRSRHHQRDLRPPRFFAMDGSRNDAAIPSHETVLLTPLNSTRHPISQSRLSTAVNAERRFKPPSSSRT